MAGTLPCPAADDEPRIWEEKLKTGTPHKPLKAVESDIQARS